MWEAEFQRRNSRAEKKYLKLALRSLTFCWILTSTWVEWNSVSQSKEILRNYTFIAPLSWCRAKRSLKSKEPEWRELLLITWNRIAIGDPNAGRVGGLISRTCDSMKGTLGQCQKSLKTHLKVSNWITSNLKCLLKQNQIFFKKIHEIHNLTT